MAARCHFQLSAKQAKDTELENHAAEIKLRAYRRMGEITRELDKAKTGPKTELDNTGVTKQAALKSAGINTMTASRAERVARLGKGEL